MPTRRVAGGVRLKVKAANLLNAGYLYTQEANGITQIQREYKSGVNFSIGLSYEF